MTGRWIPGSVRKVAAVGATAALAVGTAIACSHSNEGTGHPATRPSVSQPGIFTLLPFNQQQLDAAYNSAGHAAAAYETFSYTDTPQTYGNRIAPWVNPGYLAYLEQTFGNTTATANRIRLREHSTASSDITAIRTFGPTSITFIAQIIQHDPVTDDSGKFAVTVATTDGRTWLVSDIEPAGAGNQ